MKVIQHISMTIGLVVGEPRYAGEEVTCNRSPNFSSKHICYQNCSGVLGIQETVWRTALALKIK